MEPFPLYGTTESYRYTKLLQYPRTHQKPWWCAQNLGFHKLLTFWYLAYTSKVFPAVSRTDFVDIKRTSFRKKLTREYRLPLGLLRSAPVQDTTNTFHMINIEKLYRFNLPNANPREKTNEPNVRSRMRRAGMGSCFFSDNFVYSFTLIVKLHLARSGTKADPRGM